jgi:hypothetical protein
MGRQGFGGKCTWQSRRSAVATSSESLGFFTNETSVSANAGTDATGRPCRAASNDLKISTCRAGDFWLLSVLRAHT